LRVKVTCCRFPVFFPPCPCWILVFIPFPPLCFSAPPGSLRALTSRWRRSPVLVNLFRQRLSSSFFAMTTECPPKGVTFLFPPHVFGNNPLTTEVIWCLPGSPFLISRGRTGSSFFSRIFWSLIEDFFSLSASFAVEASLPFPSCVR